MRSLIKLLILIMIEGAVILASLRTNQNSYAETNTITIGPWTFEDTAFADNATDLSDVNLYQFKGLPSDYELYCLDASNYEECLDLVLTDNFPAGFPDNAQTFLGNIGFAGSYSNLFQLDFTDLKAENNYGPDIVFFDCHYENEENSFEIAVRPEGGDFTDPITFDASKFQETDVVCDDPATNWGVPIDLSAFGLASGTIVDAIKFSSLPDPDDGIPQGDPVMAAVLISAPVVVFMPIVRR